MLQCFTLYLGLILSNKLSPSGVWLVVQCSVIPETLGADTFFLNFFGAIMIYALIAVILQHEKFMALKIGSCSIVWESVSVGVSAIEAVSSMCTNQTVSYHCWFLRY